MLRPMARGAIPLLVLACGGAPRGEDSAGASTRGGPDAVPCVPGDPMPEVPLDTARDYTLRVVPGDTSRRYAMPEYRVPLCPPDSARAPSPSSK
jgi:hypothetical protein